ncbi:MAG: hypothetical protein PHT51_04260 [Patescibacteria group bacterium]|nr:hypothetical protein [Patescibacteria group bacterium]MDD4610750.1 hypothetical protein [Patescibacteria group bacterium]
MQDYNDYEKINEENNEGKSKIGRNQKIAVTVLAIFAVFTIGLWAMQLKNSINKPFASTNSNQENTVATTTCTGEDCPEYQAKLKTQDTDSDSLTDWDELNVYNTSPYLADSDSDGYSDYDEIKNNKDPNCPAGQTCAGAETNFQTTASSTKNSGLTTSTSTSQLNLSTDNIDNNTLQNVLGGQVDAASLRVLLKQAGMDENVLNQISDEELIQSYNETLKQNQ